jgi:hypothetical protein
LARSIIFQNVDAPKKLLFAGPARPPIATLARLRREEPIAYIPHLGSRLLCSRNDIFVSEKQIDVFSSDRPKVMGAVLGRLQ